MPTDFRQQIVTAIDTRFKTILVANGYITGIGANVDWYRLSAPPVASLPAIDCRDTDAMSWAGAGMHEHKLSVASDIYMQPTYSSADTIMRQAIADIIKCIGVDPTWGNLAADTLLPDETGLTIEQKEYCLAAIGFLFIVQFFTNAWDPYTGA